jgi:hypothetical protein
MAKVQLRIEGVIAERDMWDVLIEEMLGFK